MATRRQTLRADAVSLLAQKCSLLDRWRAGQQQIKHLQGGCVGFITVYRNLPPFL